MEENKKTSKLQKAQWIFAAFGLLMALGSFSKGGLGILGGIVLFISAVIVSPFGNNIPVLNKMPTLKVVVQFSLALVLWFIGVMLIPSSTPDAVDTSLENTIDTSPVVTESDTESETETESETIADTEVETKVETEAESETIEETENEEETEIKTVEETEEPPAHRDGMDGISDKSLTDDGIEVTYSRSVPNDVTGNWRLAKIYADINFTEYAMSYYNEYFKNDSEVHIIINYTRNETIVFNSWGSVTYHKHVEGEENDAKELAGGDVISEYFVHTDNGDIEKLY